MFTTPCFIRKNTHELMEKLIKLGYRNYTFEPKDYEYLYTSKNGFHSAIFANDPDRIDCGTNEEFFLAIAAMRDDSDKGQYFTNGKYWIKCAHDLYSKYKDIFPGEDFAAIIDSYHKATV